MFVKICGLTSRAAVAAAVNAGADALGFVFAESPRRVSPAQAVELAAEVPASVARVAVMLHPAGTEWDEVREIFRPDWLQTEHTDFARLNIPAETGRLPVYRDTDTVPSDRALPDYLLFEGGRSGAGETADWSRAAVLARHTCLLLAGGLNPDNVASAILQVYPWGVDVSSGVESKPGVKDTGKIAAFVQAVRATEVNHAG